MLTPNAQGGPTKEFMLKELYDGYSKRYNCEDMVAGEGNADAKLLLVGEAPGRDEVRLAHPFVGAAGRNLDEFLSALGIARESIYITNIIKYRLYKTNPESGRISNRPANASEIGEGKDYLFFY